MKRYYSKKNFLGDGVRYSETWVDLFIVFEQDAFENNDKKLLEKLYMIDEMIENKLDSATQSYIDDKINELNNLVKPEDTNQEKELEILDDMYNKLIDYHRNLGDLDSIMSTVASQVEEEWNQ